MKRFEPGTLDMFGANWEAGGSYRMQPDARRYEQYERSFAAVVGLRNLQHTVDGLLGNLQLHVLLCCAHGGQCRKLCQELQALAPEVSLRGREAMQHPGKVCLQAGLGRHCMHQEQQAADIIAMIRKL